MDLVLDQVEASLTQTHRSEIVIDAPIHIIGVNASLIAVQRDPDEADLDKQLLEPSSGVPSNIVRSTTSSVSLYTITGYTQGDLDKGGFNPLDAQEQGRNYISTISLSSGMPTYEAHEDLFGYFADGGLFVEFNAPSPDYGIRLIVRYVTRIQFPPAYHDPLVVMQHYWKCSRGDAEFLDGFYGGTVIDIPSSDSAGSQTRSVETEESTGLSFSHTLPFGDDWMSFD